jgi:hypothetical protein
MSGRIATAAAAAAAAACVLGAGVGLAACSSGSSSSQDGTAAADQTREQVASAFWQLDNSLRGGILSTGGTGRFSGCANSAADSLVYAILAGVEPARGANPTQAAFATSLLQGFAAAGWKLSQAGPATYTATRDGVSVRLQVLAASGGTSAQFSVQSGCVNVGSAAHQIITDYSGDATDDYPQGAASAKPVPTTFPTPPGE